MRMFRLKLAGVVAVLATLFAPAAMGGSPAPTAAPQPEWLGDAVIYEVNLRQGTTGRTLRSMQLELPRLADLGVDVLWLMPIHPISEKNRKGTLGSYYAVKDYKAVNPEFGTMEDLKEFVRTAHSLGMRVILDEVCNHTGCDNAWVTEHPEYYARDARGEMFGPFDWTDTYKLDYSNPATRAAMIDALKFWIAEADIDGYRCDVAGEVPTSFWEEARPQLEAIKPVFMLAEASKPELLAKAFDADYNWPMKDVFNAIAASKGVNAYAVAKKQDHPKSDARDIVRLMERQEKEYPAGTINMNMVTNHDLNSWEGTEFDRFGPSLGAFAVLSYTLPGMPMLYTGQEVGFNHPFEFFELDGVQPDYQANEFTVFYEMLNALKHGNRAFDAGRRGGSFTVLPTDSDDVLAFERAKDGDRAVVIVNLSGDVRKLGFRKGTPAVDGLTDYFAGTAARLPAELQPWQYLILTSAD